MGKDWDRLGPPDLGAGVRHRPAYDGRKAREGTDASFGAGVRYGLGSDVQEWHQAWATEALRVLKPGGHLLAFGGTRTYHRLVCAVEDAGFEIRDTISWLYGSGFPKSLNVGNGFGTALKPAHEPVVVARKPLSGTVAACVLEHGTGALNVDGCRVEAQTVAGAGLDVNTHLREGGVRRTSDERSSSYSIHKDEDRYEVPSAGRWPANVVLSHTDDCGYPEPNNDLSAWRCVPSCPVRLLDEQTGEQRAARPSGTHDRHNASEGRGRAMGAGWNGAVTSGVDDSGGASRFFPTFTQDTLCVLCSLPLAEPAGTYSPPSDPVNATAPGPAQELQPLEREGSDQSSGMSATTAAVCSGTTPRTGLDMRTPTAPSRAVTELASWIAQRARSAVSLCDTCTTATAHEVAEVLRNPTEASLAGPVSTSERRQRTLSRSLALIAAGMDSTGIIPTTADLNSCFGSALAATPSVTPTSATASESDLGLRLKYQSKASRGERNAGLEGFEERVVGSMNAAHDGSFPRDRPNMPKANVHPTVKPISLMRWLVRLVGGRPRASEGAATDPGDPGGDSAALTGQGGGPVILDPFCGSGTTGIACALEGFDFIGLEREQEYVAIAEARIGWWHKHRGDGEAAEILAAGELRDEVEATGQGRLFGNEEAV